MDQPRTCARVPSPFFHLLPVCLLPFYTLGRHFFSALKASPSQDVAERPLSSPFPRFIWGYLPPSRTITIVFSLSSEYLFSMSVFFLVPPLTPPFPVCLSSHRPLISAKINAASRIKAVIPLPAEKLGTPSVFLFDFVSEDVFLDAHSEVLPSLGCGREDLLSALSLYRPRSSAKSLTQIFFVLIAISLPSLLGSVHKSSLPSLSFFPF